MPNARIDQGKFIVFAPSGEALAPAVSLDRARELVAARGGVLGEAGWNAFPDYLAESFDLDAIRNAADREKDNG
ncbi:hypothetical protein [Burkholderia gladioli]|uniref:hypothetical protein n=1 Tax=Burkholderia gladioli TaxID=28095 RepID=UPI000F523591|nr:hypothetical protein [Burkholderia gladioli]MBU9272709.1 hypothetical protein [Burkholderia gladioli]